MRKMIFIIGMAVLLVTGCDQKTDSIETIPKVSDPIIESSVGNSKTERLVSKTLLTNRANFHFVADWLTDSKIVFVEKDLNAYFVKTFDLNSGKVDTLHKDNSIIVDVLIHPTQDRILLHTTDNPTSATIKILSLDGTIQDEISIQSNELAIEWNDVDPTLVLLTAFHEDWSFDVFLYKGKLEEFGLIDLEEPFPKWLGKEKILIGSLDSHPLDGGNLTIYDIETDLLESSKHENIVHFDTFGESTLIVRIDDDNNALYTIMNLEGVVSSEWTVPAVSNYSEWVFPDVSWASNNTVFMGSPEEGGQLDELSGPFRLIRVADGEAEVLSNDITPGLLRCSPSGMKCLTGYGVDKLIDIETKKVTNWIQFSE